MPSLRVLTYNILGGRQRAALRTVVESVDPDLVIVSESPQIPLWWRWACPSLAREWQLDHIAGGRNAGRNMICAGEYVGVSSTRVQRIKQPSLFDPIRGVVSAQLMISSQPFGVIGCHLGLTPESRAREIDVVLAVTDQLEGPVILGGDLNEEPGSPQWRRLQGAGFVDAGSDDALTYPADQPVRRIDALLARGDGVQITEHCVPAVPAALLARASDHRPVLAEIRW